MCSCAQSPNDCALNLFSSDATSMELSSSDRTDHKNAAGAMYVIMGFLWLVAVPALVVVIIMVSECSILI